MLAVYKSVRTLYVHVVYVYLWGGALTTKIYVSPGFIYKILITSVRDIYVSIYVRAVFLKMRDRYGDGASRVSSIPRMIRKSFISPFWHQASVRAAGIIN
jgi:hypothetical protein